MKRIIKSTVLLAIAVVAAAAMAEIAMADDAPNAKQPIPAFIFGQNLEHTRSAVQGGISAQLVKNRKFAGKPSRDGVSMMWEPYGSKAFYHNAAFGCTRHAARSAMPRRNEIACQIVGSLDPNGEAGITQGKIGIRGGVAHTFKAVVSTLHPEDAVMTLRVTDADGKVLAEKDFTVNTANSRAWTRIAFDFTLEKNTMAKIAVGVKGKNYCAIGAVSILPADNFHGMRADVVENLRDIGATIIRWPGGNFAGEYRWRDGLIEDPDERAPLDSYTEIETQPHFLGYDSNDIGMEDVIALCEKIGAEPFFTINAAWESPQDSADWVKACKGRVKMWSLGNEMGFSHMEGPKGPKGYADMVRPHAEAMLKVDPELVITSSGPYPNKTWIEESAKVLADVAPIVSYHRYDHWNAFYDYSTPETTAALFNEVSRDADNALEAMKRCRAQIPANIGISYDEWNLWYAWYRTESIVEGLYAAKMINGFMRNWEACGLKCVCYFQPVNEQAINVTPFESHLTSIGEAMRLWKGHVDGVPADVSDLPADAFVTDAQDGSRYMTFYNFSTTESKTFRIPTGGRSKVVAAELLLPNGFETGCRYERKPCEVKFDGDFCEVVLAPAAQAGVRVAK
ncbi:MAG: hypothetical protein IJH67_13540 [Thermoguttaceae bacterium]|nr:hypothetical protein [Thermoguttaceae bacterium]